MELVALQEHTLKGSREHEGDDHDEDNVHDHTAKRQSSLLID